jgi:Tfp pilus assembly protein PilN
MRKTRLGVDTCGDAIYWVRSTRTARGPRVVDWGSLPRVPSPAHQTLRARRASRGDVPAGPAATALDASAMVLKRMSLPAMRSSDARRVAERRAEDLFEFEEEATFAWLHRESGRACPLWLCAAPLRSAHEALAEWSRRGVDVALLASRQLALGNLVRALPEAENAGLTAVLDLDQERGTCVLADHEGWVFGREFPLHDLGEDGVLPPGGREATPSEERLDIWAMRLATELRRTFRYVEGELALGQVTRLCVAGSSTRIAEVCPLLEGRLEMPATALGDALLDGPARRLPDAAAVALGLALWPSGDGGNLVPLALRKKRARDGVRRRLLATLGCLVATVALGAATLMLHRESLRSRIAELDARLGAARSTRAVVAEHEQARQRAGQLEQAILRVDRPLPGLSGLLTTLSRLIPDSVHVESLRAAHTPDGWTVLIQVEATGTSVAEAARAVSELARALETTPLIALERVVQEEVPSFGNAPDARARVRFQMQGRLAPLGSTGVAAGRPIDGEDGDV